MVLPPEIGSHVANDNPTKSGNRTEADAVTKRRSRRKRAPSWKWGGKAGVDYCLNNQVQSTAILRENTTWKQAVTTSQHSLRVLPGAGTPLQGFACHSNEAPRLDDRLPYFSHHDS